MLDFIRCCFLNCNHHTTVKSINNIPFESNSSHKENVFQTGSNNHHPDSLFLVAVRLWWRNPVCDKAILMDVTSDIYSKSAWKVLSKSWTAWQAAIKIRKCFLGVRQILQYAPTNVYKQASVLIFEVHRSIVFCLWIARNRSSKSQNILPGSKPACNQMRGCSSHRM